MLAALASWKLVVQAFVFLLVLYGWNALGRFIETLQPSQDTSIRAKRMRTLGAIVQTFLLAAVLFVILIFVISGAVDNPTDFRYADF